MTGARVTMAVWWAAALTASAGGDEARGPNGRLGGTLLWRGGNLVLQAPDGRTLARGAELGRVRLAGGRTTFAAVPVHRVVLGAGDELTGVLGRLKDGVLPLRTGWADRLAIPVADIRAVTHSPGRRTVACETFADKPRRLAAGQPVTLPVAPLTAGRVAVLFEEEGRPAGARWVVESRYAIGSEARRVCVTLAGRGDSLAVDAGGLRGTSRAVARSPGPRLLTLEHSAGSLRIACGDEALWYSFGGGPGALRGVRLVCEGDAKATGGVSVWAVAVEAVEPVRRRPPGDPARDELWLTGGDQLFGSVRQAGPAGVEIAGPFGARAYAWRELRGWYPRRAARRPAAVGAGLPVRLEVDSGLRADPDVLLGWLTGLDARRATLRHPVLGELTIPRSRVVAVEVRK